MDAAPAALHLFDALAAQLKALASNIHLSSDDSA
jgi:hypothetical protein